ncbi:hypothetical protein BaRGS_00005641 [Batillaria attramentaria]|uniref:Uncharacterized protein n=1 Tax=Batillaria attramentaria TaxID=370345 RepID=A0ABD0LTP6_9CAEN
MYLLSKVALVLEDELGQQPVSVTIHCQGQLLMFAIVHCNNELYRQSSPFRWPLNPRLVSDPRNHEADKHRIGRLIEPVTERAVD